MVGAPSGPPIHFFQQDQYTRSSANCNLVPKADILLSVPVLSPIISRTNGRLLEETKNPTNGWHGVGNGSKYYSNCAASSSSSIRNPTDSAFDCAGFSREYAANERQIMATLKERSQAQGKNIVLGVAGVFFLPSLFYGPEITGKVEIEALRSRNKVLESR